MSKTIEIGPYSAYAIAVKYGYDGTEEDWIKAVEAARKSAETSAANATQKANEASASATTATEQAGIATTKAGDAASSAAAASTSRQAAEKAQKAAEDAAALAGTRAGTDKTLSIENAPADAKATGDALAGKADKSTVQDESGNAIFYSKAEVEAKIKEILAAQRKEDLARIKFWVSPDSTSPAKFYGGTWERIEGKFIMGASNTYPAGSTGGSTEHEHEYKLLFMWRFGALVGYPSSAIAAYNYKTQSWNDNNKKVNDGQYTLANDGFSSTYGEKPGGETYSVVGNTASSSSIPPYYSVYIWRRVA